MTLIDSTLKHRERILQAIRDLPFHRYLGIEKLAANDGQATLSLTVNKNTLNPGGMFHGAVAYAIADITAYAAAVSTLEENQEAVTHDLHVSMLRPADDGDRIVTEANVVKRGRSIIFIDVNVYKEASHSQPDKSSQPSNNNPRVLIATVRVTKSVINY
ncbi:PaaI family thioesterase [Aurantivibrio plasticivorans]